MEHDSYNFDDDTNAISNNNGNSEMTAIASFSPLTSYI